MVRRASDLRRCFLSCLHENFNDDAKSALLIKGFEAFDSRIYSPYDRLVTSAEQGTRTYTLELDVFEDGLDVPQWRERLSFAFFFQPDSLDPDRQHLTLWIGESSISLGLAVMLARDWLSFELSAEDILAKYTLFTRRG